MEQITIKNPNFSWGLAIRKGLTTFGWSALGYIATEFSSEVVLASALGTSVPVSVKIPVATLLAGVFKSVANYAKNRRIKLDSDGTNGAGTAIPVQGLTKPLALAVLVLSSTFAFAQAPEKDCALEITGCKAELSLDAGLMQFAQRGNDHKDFTYRLNASVKIPSNFKLEMRADWTRTQDGGNLFDPHTFKSVEAWGAVSRAVFSSDTLGFDVLGLSGVSWNRDKDFDPEDPRLWTAGLCVRARVSGRGSAMPCLAHHGPVGGVAFLGSVTYDMGSGAWWFGDVAVPLSRASFLANPYTVKFGIAGRLKRFKKGNN